MIANLPIAIYRSKTLDWTAEKILDYSLKIVGAIGALLATTGVTKIIEKKLEANKLKKLNEEVSNHYNSLIAMRDSKLILTELAQNPKVYKTMLLKGSNSGGIPEVGKPYYSRIIDGAGHCEFAIREYSQVNVDLNYIQLLIKLIEDKKVHIDVDKQDDSLLKKIYEKEKITNSIWYLLSINKLEYFFMTVCTDSEFSDEDEDNFDLLANKMTTIFSKI